MVYLVSDCRAVRFMCVNQPSNTGMARSLQFFKVLASDIVAFNCEK